MFRIRKRQNNESSAEKYQNLVNNLSVGVYRNTPGPEGHFLEANPAIISLFEANSKEEFMKHNVSDLYQDPMKRSAFVEKITKYGFVKNEELDLVTLKGKKLTCSVSAVMKKNTDGSVYFDGLIEDVTERKQMVEALKKARDELETRVMERTQELEDSKKAIANVLEDLNSEKAKDEAILASIGDGLIATNQEGTIITMSHAAETLLKCSAKELLGKKLHETLHIYDEKGAIVPFAERPIQIALATGKSTTVAAMYFYERSDGVKFPASITVTPIILDQTVVGAVEVFRDVTHEREVDKTKTEFVSIASHQLRTPLATISWYTEMLLAGDAGQVNEEQKKYLEEVYRNNRRTVDLINVLLNVSRLEMGTFTVEPEPTDLVKLVQSVIDDQIPQINECKIQFSTSFEKNIPLMPIDQKLLRMVLQNLLSNAVKYTPDGGKITLELTLSDVSHVLIKISDTGYGIPKIQQDKVFTKLFRADNVREKNAEGTGLGLYIVKYIIDHIGGKIRFESEENKGTIFYVTLPLAGMKQKQ
jgi:PAS domain S-box-containing protein